MDLYKWAYKFYPWTPSDLLADCFLFALEIRELDMQGSPYDVTEFGLEPIPIETPEGRALYQEKQQDLSLRSQPLRKKLHAHYAYLLASRFPASWRRALMGDRGRSPA